ncbi:MAG: HTH domain-containing protein [Flavobacteriales bacterium]|nr:HTH domain-containing protein [Flavobacteriales bacterium]
MSKKPTFRDVILKTLEKAGVPLTPKEIWEEANELGTIGDFTTTGKTPWNTIAALCYTDIKRNGENSAFIQTSERPARFYLRKYYDFNKVSRSGEKGYQEAKSKKRFQERDLHPLVVAYAYAESHFRAFLKTIHHENSHRASKGQNEWLHPDLVGVYFPFQDFREETLEIQKYLSVNSIKLFSFEVKVSLDYGNLRQSYFQAVSNSSWAHEGYLVTLNFEEDPSFRDEVRRLNNAFGIGVILLNPENIHESQILYPSRVNHEIDWDTVNRLACENQDFCQFLKLITEDCKLGKVKSQYDKILCSDELSNYVKEKGILEILEYKAI